MSLDANEVITIFQSIIDDRIVDYANNSPLSVGNTQLISLIELRAKLLASLQQAAGDYISVSQIGVPNGIASLDENGEIVSEQIPGFSELDIDGGTYP